jgi:PAS domain-containing protein
MANIRNWRVILASAMAFIILVLASASGFWRSGNQVFSDWLFDLGAISLDQVPNVLLIEQPAATTDAMVLINLVTELDRLGAKRTVILPEAIEDLPEAVLERLGDRVLVLHLPGSAGPTPDTAASLAVPTFEAGYFRQIPLTAGEPSLGESSDPKPWFLALDSSLRQDRTSLYLNFGFLKHGLPIVAQQQVLAGEVIPEIVEGRVAILGPADNGLPPGYPVPGTDSHLNTLKIQGLAWATAEAGVGLGFFSPLLQVGLILLLFFVNLLVFQWLSPIFGSVFSLFALAVIGVSGWFSLQVFQTVLPVVDLSVVQLASLLFVYQARRASEDRTITEMLGTTNAALFERYIPEAFNESVSPWPKLVVFIRQQLNLERSILLERVPGDHRVREIESINCRLDDIAEQRRDYERVPYSDALQHRKPLQLKRRYFDSPAPEELEYLTPLIFAGEVLGFWALTVKPEDDWSREAFESNIDSFALQISELLYHRKQLALEKQRSQRLGRRILALEVGRNHPDQLQSALELLGNRLATLESMFDSLRTGAIMYDLFGQVLQANARALAIAGQANLAVYKLTALDFLCELCGVSQDNARRHLRHVTLKRAEVRLPVRGVASDRGLVLAIRPISTETRDRDAITGADAAQPFKLLGLSFEITDSSHAGAALEKRDDILQQMLLSLRDQLSRLTLSAHLTSPDLKEIPSGERLLGELRQFASGVESTLGELEEQVAAGEDSEEKKTTEPVNMVRVANRALRRNEQTISQKRLTVLRDLPLVVPLVGAIDEELTELMDRILDLLSEDATPGSQLVVSVKERAAPDPLVSISMSNVGYGLPQATLDRILAKPVVELLHSDDPIEETLGKFKSVSYWGGQAEVSSSVGKGFCFHIRFRSLAFDPSTEEQAK